MKLSVCDSADGDLVNWLKADTDDSDESNVHETSEVQTH